MSGPLAGVRVIELGGIGPVPFACMLLADLGERALAWIVEAGETLHALCTDGTARATTEDNRRRPRR